MTKKNYIRAAEIIRSVYPIPGVKRVDCITAFARFFEEDNPKFDHDRFYDACMVDQKETAK